MLSRKTLNWESLPHPPPTHTCIQNRAKCFSLHSFPPSFRSSYFSRSSSVPVTADNVCSFPTRFNTLHVHFTQENWKKMSENTSNQRKSPDKERQFPTMAQSMSLFPVSIIHTPTPEPPIYTTKQIFHHAW